MVLIETFYLIVKYLLVYILLYLMLQYFGNSSSLKIDKTFFETVKKHLKPKNNNGTGEIVEVERPIHRSNVMIIDPKTKKPTKIKMDFDKDGKKIRISKKSNEKID